MRPHDTWLQRGTKVMRRWLSLPIVILLMASAPVHAALYTFSFSNEDGTVAGTVSGTITLPDGDGTFAATSIFITSAPAAFGYTTPVDVFTYFSNLGNNSFVVSSGQIDGSLSTFAAATASLNELFTLNGTYGSALLDFNNSILFIDQDNSTLVYGVAPVPGPSSLGLLGLGVLGLAFRARRVQLRSYS